MIRSRWRGACLGGLLLAAGGCRMCADTPYDYTYPAYGGLLQRTDMFHGRVGSAFTPDAGAMAPPIEGGIHEGAIPAQVDGPPAPIEAEPIDAAPRGVAPIEPASYEQPANARSSRAESPPFNPGDILSSRRR